MGRILHEKDDQYDQLRVVASELDATMIYQLTLNITPLHYYGDKAAYDYGKFLTVLRKYQPICDFKLIAYCLMSNHIHLLIKTGEMPMSRIFQRIIPSFVYWYNKKYERVGNLFQARFLSSPVNNSSQLLTVVRYIHQNPVKAAICNHPGQYQYSSYVNYFSNDLIDSSFVRSIRPSCSLISMSYSGRFFFPRRPL